MDRRDPWREIIEGGRGAPPRYSIVILACLVGTLIVGMFEESQPWLDWLRLGPELWERGCVWKLVTYAFVSYGGVGLKTILPIALIYWFSTELEGWIGRDRTRMLILVGVPLAGALAAGGQLAAASVGLAPCKHPFWMMQGQQVLLALVVGAYAACNRRAALKRLQFLFGLTIPSRWLVWVQLGWALMAFASTRDVAGFIGIATATGWGWWVAIRAEMSRT